MTEWDVFFPGGSRVMALPSWEQPRLLIPAANVLTRWQRSALYPAFRTRAQLYRLALRVRAAAFRSRDTRISPSSRWLLEAFIASVLPEACVATVFIGTPGPARKITVQLCDSNGREVGFAKYAETLPARKRLRHEYNMLRSLPPGLGPVPLKYGPWHKGEVLLTAPLDGMLVPPLLPPSRSVFGFVEGLETAGAVPLENHPAIPPICALPGGEAALAAWPVVIHHGDLAPWNLRKPVHGRLKAFDWEYAARDGFPYLDLAYYMMQIGRLICRWMPRESAGYAVYCLARNQQLGLTRPEAEAIVRVAAIVAHAQFQNDGHRCDEASQQWWETASKYEA